MAFEALLVDVGGTLLPDNLPDDPALVRARDARLAAILPELEPDALARLLVSMLADARAGLDRLEQHTSSDIAGRLEAADVRLSGRVEEVRTTLGRHVSQRLDPFPGHRELLLAAGELGLRRVLVTNTSWLSDEDWQEWRAPELGLTGLLDGVVTSYSAGYRKPHRAMFDSALALAGCGPEACVFTGDKERKDVEPALALGMTVIRVAIQEPPTPTAAQYLVTSLEDAVRVLRRLR
jgi:FMN phosphatase YigB (HAD superfamily)